MVLGSDPRFAAVVTERVVTAQVLRRRVSLTESVGATVIATRACARDVVTWRVVIDPGVVDDVAAGAVAAAANRAVAELRSLAGC